MTSHDDSARRRGRRSTPDARRDPAGSTIGSVADPPARSTARPTARRGRLVAVVGAVGGAGATVLACALAVRAAAAGLHSCAVDADPWAGGMDVTFGAEQSAGLRWPDLAGLEGDANGPALRSALPSAEGVRVLSHGREIDNVPSRVVLRVVDALVPLGDLTVLDLGLRDPMGSTLAAAADLVVLVSSAQLRGVAALTAHAAWLSASGVVPVVVLRTDRAESPGDVVDIVETQLDLRVAGVFSDERSVRADLIHGIPPGHRRSQVTTVADALLAKAIATGQGAA